MKAFFCLSFVLFLLGAHVTYAQKLGHLNTADLLQLMPEARTADSLLEVFKRSLIVRDSLMTVEYDVFLANIGDKVVWPDSVKARKQKQLQELESNLRNFEDSAQTKLQDKRLDLYDPINKKVTDAIAAVAKENGYAYILDMSGGAVIYAWDADDITSSVKKKLGLK